MGGREENVEIRKVNIKKFFKLKESIESKILRYKYNQNTSRITQKGKNTQTYSDIEIIQKVKFNTNYVHNYIDFDKRRQIDDTFAYF